MPNIDDLIRDKLSSDGQVLNLKAQFLREVGAKELAKKEELKNVLTKSVKIPQKFRPPTGDRR